MMLGKKKDEQKQEMQTIKGDITTLQTQNQEIVKALTALNSNLEQLNKNQKQLSDSQEIINTSLFNLNASLENVKNALEALSKKEAPTPKINLDGIITELQNINRQQLALVQTLKTIDTDKKIAVGLNSVKAGLVDYFKTGKMTLNVNFDEKSFIQKLEDKIIQPAFRPYKEFLDEARAEVAEIKITNRDIISIIWHNRICIGAFLVLLLVGGYYVYDQLDMVLNNTIVIHNKLNEAIYHYNNFFGLKW